jgi:hypothetical protein
MSHGEFFNTAVAPDTLFDGLVNGAARAFVELVAVLTNHLPQRLFNQFNGFGGGGSGFANA